MVYESLHERENYKWLLTFCGVTLPMGGIFNLLIWFSHFIYFSKINPSESEGMKLIKTNHNNSLSLIFGNNMFYTVQEDPKTANFDEGSEIIY